MSDRFRQLPLALQLRDDATFDNFTAHGAGAALVIDQLCRQLAGGDRLLYLFGAVGSGRSHLLQAACHHWDQRGHSCVYLPLSQLRGETPAELFEGLEQLALICLDDLQAVAGDTRWEEALFHLFNRAQLHGTALLMSADAPARALPVLLPDLASRLSSAAVHQLPPPDDASRRQILRFRAARRGLEVPEEVADFLLHRARRDMDNLLEVLAVLDRASLSAQRRLTIPFIKEVLGW